jgi:hypothetical protein
MLKHRIIFSKPIYKSDSSCTFKLVASVKIDDYNVMGVVKDFIKTYQNAVRCNIANNTLYIHITTNSRCSSYDKPDEIKGVRIAESKAKSNLYKALYRLALKLCVYYSCIGESYKKSMSVYYNINEKECLHIIKIDKGDGYTEQS